MAISQTSALTGYNRNLQGLNYENLVQTRASLLPSIYAQRDAEAARKAALALQQNLSDSDLAFQREALAASNANASSELELGYAGLEQAQAQLEFERDKAQKELDLAAQKMAAENDAVVKANQIAKDNISAQEDQALKSNILGAAGVGVGLYGLTKTPTIVIDPVTGAIKSSLGSAEAGVGEQGLIGGAVDKVKSYIYGGTESGGGGAVSSELGVAPTSTPVETPVSNTVPNLMRESTVDLGTEVTPSSIGSEALNADTLANATNELGAAEGAALAAQYTPAELQALGLEAGQLTGGVGTGVATEGAVEGAASGLGAGTIGLAAAPLIMTAMAIANNSIASGRNYPVEMYNETRKGIQDFSNMITNKNYNTNALRDLYTKMHSFSTGANPKWSSMFSDADIDRDIMKATGLNADSLRTTLGYPDLPDFTKGDNSTLSNFMTGQRQKLEQNLADRGLSAVALPSTWQEGQGGGSVNDPFNQALNIVQNWDYWAGAPVSNVVTNY